MMQTTLRPSKQRNNDALSRELSPKQIKAEWLKCSRSPLYFINTYVHIEAAAEGEWVRFDMWPAQGYVIKQLMEHLKFVILKARQLGQTWLLLAFCLWLMLFRPIAAIGLFSRREEEAIDLLDRRMKGMYKRLPDWMRARSIAVDSKKHWQLSNGSWARAFPTNTGDSYTFTLVLVDEADLSPDLDTLLGAVKPTVDAGGWLILLGRSNKKEPNSIFKSIYRAAKARKNGYRSIFLPWSARPDRTPEWYAQQVNDSLADTGSLDYVHEQYPAKDVQALAPRSLDKRIPPQWLEQCYVEMEDIEDPNAPSIPGLFIYRPPEDGHSYVIGADPAEGNPTSDDSSFTVCDRDTGEEVASLAGKLQPSTFAEYLDQVGLYYHNANLLVERNNHGHAVILWLHDNSALFVLPGHDGKPGWLSNSKGKSLLYNTAADNFKDNNAVIHNFETYMQLSSIEGSSLRAPEGANDDRADSYALSQQARTLDMWVLF